MFLAAILSGGYLLVVREGAYWESVHDLAINVMAFSMAALLDTWLNIFREKAIGRKERNRIFYRSLLTAMPLSLVFAACFYGLRLRLLPAVSEDSLRSFQEGMHALAWGSRICGSSSVLLMGYLLWDHWCMERENEITDSLDEQKVWQLLQPFAISVIGGSLVWSGYQTLVWEMGRRFAGSGWRAAEGCGLAAALFLAGLLGLQSLGCHFFLCRKLPETAGTVWQWAGFLLGQTLAGIFFWLCC